MTEKTCWVVTDGRAGMVAGALGLAEAVGLPFQEKVIRLAAPWRYLPPSLWPPGILGTSPDGDSLEAPFPDLIISCGRHAVGPAVEIRRRARGKCLAVHVQHPRVPARLFDLIAAPAHDGLTGDNVIVTHGALGRVSREKIDQAAKEAATRFDHLPRPLIAVSIGGSSKIYNLDAEFAARIGKQLTDLANEHQAALLVTASRRTGEDAERALREALRDIPGEFWDGSGENPYFAYLGAADAIIVTGDSVNMVSEACSTGKPVMVIHLPSSRTTKFDRFHADLERIGATRPFDGTLARWDYTPLQETARVAEFIHKRLEEKAMSG